MAQRSGRLTCPRCGANNFETVSVCWKCGTPLAAAPAGMAAPAAPAVPNYSRAERPSAPPAAPSPVIVYPQAATGDSGAAKRAALALAITMPWFGLPIGWAFMMFEDSRRQAIGRFCALWSMVALVFHLIFMFAALQSAASIFARVVVPMMGNMKNGGGIPSGGNGLEGLGGLTPQR